jgi:hypothetical protein
VIDAATTLQDSVTGTGIEQGMRHEPRARGDVLMGAYARIGASSRLYDSDRDDFHGATVLSEWTFRTDDIG